MREHYIIGDSMSNLNQQFQKTDRGKLKEALKIANLMAVPKLLKIVLNIGLGEALENKKVIEEMAKEFSVIAGQKPVVTHAKGDISAFKLRKGEAIGLKVTLRGERMYDFFEKFVKIVLPRIRDFRGVSDKGFDGRGSFSIGMKEQIVFPEIEYSQVDKVRSFEITFVSTCKNAAETKKLLEILGIPFVKTKLV